MDALSDIVKTVQLSAKTYFIRGFDGPWNMGVIYRPQGVVHAVIAGQCCLREPGSENLLRLEAGDIVAFPTGGDHWISDCPESQDLAARNVVKVGSESDLLLLKTGDVDAIAASEASPPESTDSIASEGTTTLLSSTLSYDTTVNHPFLKYLPCFIHSRIDRPGGSQMTAGLVQLLAAESGKPSLGSTIMVDRLTEMLFVQLLRTHMAQRENASGYMAALSDPNIGVALNLVHTETDERWTVEALCKAAAISRTSFTEKFTSLVGSTPKAYLTNTRMLKARSRLQRSTDTILSIAEDAGYSSEAAFGKAIKKHFNRTPGQIRKAFSESRREGRDSPGSAK